MEFLSQFHCGGLEKKKIAKTVKMTIHIVPGLSTRMALTHLLHSVMKNGSFQNKECMVADFRVNFASFEEKMRIYIILRLKLRSIIISIWVYWILKSILRLVVISYACKLK